MFPARCLFRILDAGEISMVQVEVKAVKPTPYYKELNISQMEP